ncbi:carbon starvation CstA family protein [Psychrobacter immobilis]
MNSAIVLLVGVAAMLCGYVFYSKFIATKILALDNSLSYAEETVEINLVN